MLSKVAARIYLPFGENLTNDTGGLSSSISVFKHCPDAVSHIRLEQANILLITLKLIETRYKLEEQGTQKTHDYCTWIVTIHTSYNLACNLKIN